MPKTAETLRTSAHIVTYFGLWTGTQFASSDGRLSITAAIYRAVTKATPNAFLDNEDAALALIGENPTVMNAVKFLSACLDTEPPVDKATRRYDHIEHIERYAAEKPPHSTTPPTEAEVIGRILRAAQTADNLAGLSIPRPHTAA